MPKLKTNKTVTKKIKVTKNGKVVRARAFASHLKAKKRVNNRKRGKQVKVESISMAPWNKLTV